MWQEKARSSTSFCPPRAARFTGVAIDSDTYKDRFYMLPEKLSSMVEAHKKLAAAQLSTPRRIARVRGKTLHYGCAIGSSRWRRGAPSLSQLMHCRDDRETREINSFSPLNPQFFSLYSDKRLFFPRPLSLFIHSLCSYHVRLSEWRPARAP